MKAPTALETLATLNAQQTEAAALVLGVTVAQRDDAQQQLAMLQQLRADYEGTLRQRISDGLCFASYHNFRAFLLKIDDAIHGQQQIVSQAETRADGARAQWKEKQREGMQWATLKQRIDKAAQAKTTRQERKLTDEFAARVFMRKKESC